MSKDNRAEIDADQATHGQRRSRRPDRIEIDVSVSRLATEQDGVVSAGELADLGMTRGARDHRLAAAGLFVVHRGVYLVGHEATTLRGRAIAALRACGDDSTLGHLIALAVWGVAAPPATIDVIVPPGRRRSRPGVRVHHVALAPDEISLRDGLRLTSPARTLLDLAAVLPFAQLERACADAMVAKLITPAELASAVASAGGRRGIVALRQIAGLAEPTRSATERAFVRAVKEAGLPRPIVNAPYMVEGLGRIKPDFLWARQRVIVETDAFGTHGHASAFESDRERDVALSVLGWLVLRFTRRQVVAAPRRLATRVAQALALRGASISV